MQQLAVGVMFLLTGTPAQERALAAGEVPSVSAAQAQLATGLTYGGFGVVALAGVLTLLLAWARWRRQDARLAASG